MGIAALHRTVAPNSRCTVVGPMGTMVTSSSSEGTEHHEVHHCWVCTGDMCRAWSHMVAFQSSLMLSTSARRSHIVFKTSFPSSSTKHWPVNTVMESAGMGQEVKGSMDKVTGPCLHPVPAQGQETRAAPALCDSGNGESRQEGSRVEMGTQQLPEHPLHPGTGR